jgi:cytochrome c556
LKSRVLSIVAIGATLAAAGAAYAQLSPKDAVGVRINAYRETGAAFKTINDQLKSGTPVKIMLRTSARTISNTARDQYNWFPAGSGAETGLKTKAKAVIWSDPAGFKAAQDRLAQEAALMSKVVETGDAAAMQKQAKALGQACAACHQKYRQRED